MVKGTWSERNIGGEATGSTDDTSDSSSDSSDSTANQTGDVEIENKFNDFTSYWDATEGEETYKISPDNPDVRIYISRQILPEDDEENEADEDAESNIAGLDDPDITKENTTSIQIDNGESLLAHKSTDTNVDEKLKTILNSSTSTNSSPTTHTTGNKKSTNKATNTKKKSK